MACYEMKDRDSTPNRNTSIDSSFLTMFLSGSEAQSSLLFPQDRET
jgi:hypothetical protein